MIVNHDNYMILSANSNTPFWEHWEAEPYPAWCALTGIAHVSGSPPGTGIEPHYHDCDEFWLFTAGRGEGWLDGELYEIMPNTAVYNSMGVIHRFQLFTPGAGAGLIARLERQRRPGRLHVDEVGPPEPTVPGFVVPGARNAGPFPLRGPRCPLSELRCVVLAPGERVADGQTPAHEYWMVIRGGLHLGIDNLAFDLVPGDLAVLRTGTSRDIESGEGAGLILARE